MTRRGALTAAVWCGCLAVFHAAFQEAAVSQDAERPAIVSVQKIWARAPHNAFTDLIRFNDRWFCVFREGQAHVSPDGAW